MAELAVGVTAVRVGVLPGLGLRLEPDVRATRGSS